MSNTILIHEHPTAVIQITEPDGVAIRIGAFVTISEGGGGGGVTSHGDLDDLETDDHPQYLRTDGARTLTGNLAVAVGITIDGVDVGGIPATVTAAQAAAIASSAASLAAHTGDTSGAHAANAIAFTPTDDIDAVEVQAAIEELAADTATSFGVVVGVIVGHTGSTENPHAVTAAQAGALETPTGTPDEGDVVTYSGGAAAWAAPAGGGLPTVRALRAPSVAHHLTIPDITSGSADYTLLILARMGRHTGARQSLLFGDRCKIQIEDNNVATFRYGIVDSGGSMSDQTPVIGADVSRWGLFSVARRNNGGTLETFAGLNGWRHYATPGGTATAPSTGGLIHIGSGDAGGPAAETDIAAVAAVIGTYLDPTRDFDLLDASMSAGSLTQVDSLLTHLWRANASGSFDTVIGAVSATLTGSALTVVNGAPRW
jgi:hypothetical protein